MTDAEMVAAIRDLLSGVDMHRNREKRDAMQAIRELVGLDEKAPEPAPVVEPEPVAEPEPQSGGAEPETGGTSGEDEAPTSTNAPEPVESPAEEPEEPVRRGPGRPRKTPAIAPED